MITGGTGFIGRNLSEALSANYHVFAPPHRELELLDYDALHSYIKAHKIDAIVHAAIHVGMFNGYDKIFFNDMLMFANIEKASRLVDKVLYFGSGAEFDKRRNITMIREEMFGECIPNTEYGLAKYTMNQIARSSENIYNLRLFGIFGKYELWEIKFLSNIACKAVFDLPMTIRRDCRFDFFPVTDLPDIVSWFLKNAPLYHDYNVCHGKQYWLSELATMIREISGKQLEIQLLSEDKAPDYSASNERLCAEIPGLRLTPMRKALTVLYEYYDTHRDEIDYCILKNSK